MDEELEKTNTETEVAAPETPETTAVESENPAETAKEETAPNGELMEYINKYAPGSDTSTPEGLQAACTEIILKHFPFIDKVFDMAETDDLAAATIFDLIQTGSLVKAIARNYNPEEKQALVEELEDDSYEEDRQMYQDKIKGQKEYSDRMAVNMAASQMGAQEFVDEVGATDQDIEAFKPFVDSFFADIEDRKLTKKHWLAIWKAYKYDSDVSEAEENGKVIGRNEKIVAAKKSREDIKGLLPEANASANIPQANKKEEDPFLNSLRKKTEEKPVLS